MLGRTGDEVFLACSTDNSEEISNLEGSQSKLRSQKVVSEEKKTGRRSRPAEVSGLRLETHLF